MNLKTKDIMINQQAEFIKLKESDYYSLNIFEEGDNVNNNAFLHKMEEYNMNIWEKIEQASQVFKEIIVQLTRSVVVEKSCEMELISTIDIFLAKHSIKTPDKKAVVFDKSKNHLILSKSKLLEALSLFVS